ncbi:MAG: sodium-dependent transporter [Cyanobacteria bacterium MAG CAR1_bin_15]|nr:sodium-dependent transporter [Cyanobacteria bacterium MAG CAR1_bin_15]
MAGLENANSAPSAPSASARQGWSSSLGFVLAAAGSAIGLGNLWGLTYRVALGGGMAFLVLYLVAVVVLGFPLLLAELALGRHTRRSPLLATVAVGGASWRPLGWLFPLGSALILGYYAVIAGWVAQALLAVLQGRLPTDQAGADAFFLKLSQGWAEGVAYGLVLALTVAVVATGVQQGIERLSRWSMPALLVLLTGLVIWSASLADAPARYEEALLQWRWSDWLNPRILRQAFSQAFFSLGLGSGAMVAYGSHLGQREPLPRQAAIVTALDTGVGLMAVLIIVPLMSAVVVGRQGGAGAVGSLFVAIPLGFASLGNAGPPLMAAFFFLASLAAVTSAVALLEAPVAVVMDRLGWGRARTAWSTGAVVALLGLPALLRTDLLMASHDLFGGVVLMASGLLLSLLMGWAAPRQLTEELSQLPAPLLRGVLLSLRWAAPLLLGGVLALSCMEMIQPGIPLLGM